MVGTVVVAAAAVAGLDGVVVAGDEGDCSLEHGPGFELRSPFSRDHHFPNIYRSS